ncbi:BlaI/MecI/CopY family transcriptional regulator [Anaerolentibacter hominis]|uniref:BlaI/MecI/CopY family transcriptional regulator n=1 Tax=Anaerolentibacter hominis TaxID=3079009 RepID=UPI0031B7EFD8
MLDLELCNSELKLAAVVWEHEPLGSGELVRLCQSQLNWKKSTTYTILKKLCERGILRNENTIVTSIIKQKHIQKFESRRAVDTLFNGSLSDFLAAYLEDRTLDKKEASSIKRLIDQCQKE